MPAQLPFRSQAIAHPGSAARRALQAFAVLVLIAAPPDLAAQEAPGSADLLDAQVETVADQTTATAGWRIFRDPDSGQLLTAPLPGQAESLAAKWKLRQAATTSDEGLRTFPVILRGRTIGIGVALDDRFVTSTILRRHDDGSRTLACVDGSPPTPAPASLPLAER